MAIILPGKKKKKNRKKEGKFGYILDMNLENKIKMLLYSWPTGIYHKNISIWKKKIFG
jgi:tricorn protease-like protein